MLPETLGALRHGNGTATHLMRRAQCARHVCRTADSAPAVCQHVKRGLRRTGRLFEDGIDAAAGFALPLHQTGRPAHDFNTVIQPHIHQLALVVRIVAAAHGADGGMCAVFANLRNIKPARLIARLVALAVHIDARGRLHRVFQRGQPPVVHRLARDHAHRLRRIFGRKFHARGGRHFVHRIKLVGTHAFRCGNADIWQ